MSVYQRVPSSNPQPGPYLSQILAGQSLALMAATGPKGVDLASGPGGKKWPQSILWETNISHMAHL